MHKLVAMVILLALCGCAGGGFSKNNVHERFAKTLPASGVTALHLKSVAGTVRVQAWDKPQIRIDAVKSAPDKDALNGLRVAVDETNGTVEISTQYDGGFGASRGGVEYALMVPSGLNLQIENTAGTITLAGLAGDVSADAKAGTIEATMTRVAGNQHIELNATTGTVTLRIPKNSDATVQAQSTIGNFESDFPGLTRTQRHLVGEGANGTIGKGSATIDLTTTTGSIELRST